jgi:hypothetical protein
MVYATLTDETDWIDIRHHLNNYKTPCHLHHSEFEPSIYMVIVADRDLMHLKCAIDDAGLNNFVEVQEFFPAVAVMLTGEPLDEAALKALEPSA